MKSTTTAMRQVGSFTLSAVALFHLSFFGLLRTAPEKVFADEEPTAIRIELSKLADSTQDLSDGCSQCVRIAFLDDDLLALTFTKSGNLPKGKIGESVTRSGPIAFRTVLLDVKTEQPRATLDWSSATSSFEFLPTHNGQFFLATPQEIKLYSRSFQLLGQRDLPPKGPGSTFSHAIASRSGDRIVVSSYHGRQTRLELLDAQSLQILRSWITSESVIDFAADDNAVAVETRSGIQLSVGDESWRTVQTFPAPCTNRFVLEFIGDERLAFRGCDNGIAVVDTSGKLLFNTAPFAPHTEFYRIATSRNGPIFGALVYKTYCAASWFACLFDPIMGSTPERVVIYDAVGGKSIYERRIGGDHKHPLGEITLSPQGSSLAVLFGVSSGRVNGVVEIFGLPVEIQSAP